jgi:prepilin-type N-terminal cleavage/methylation domain-containing protein
MKKHKGFTLVELLVVIAIIGLLSTLAVVSLNNARQKAREARKMSDLKQISTAMELYYSENSSYPTVGAACDAGGAGGVTVMAVETAAIDAMCCGAGNPLLDSSNTYLNTIPCDPIDTSPDIYYYEGSATTYCIAAQIDTTPTYFVCANGSCFNNGGNNCPESP